MAETTQVTPAAQVLVVPAGTTAPALGSTPLPSSLLESIRAHQQNASAKNTTRAYASDWARFERWCVDHDQNPLPASGETVAAYLGRVDQEVQAQDRRVSMV